jgi:hypothetical protein
VRSHAKAASAGSNSGTGTTRARKSLFGIACLCVLGLTVFLGSGASSATAANGECPNEEFRTGPSALLPDCRAYEQVSPVDKNGQDVRWQPIGSNPGGGQIVSENGGAAVFQAEGAFAGQTWGGSFSGLPAYLARRSSTDWQTTPMIPRPTPAAGGGIAAISAIDLQASMLRSSALLTEDQFPGGNRNYYVRDNRAETVEAVVSAGDIAAATSSPDLSNFVFESDDVLTAEPEIQGTTFEKVYEVSDEGTRLVSIAPDGTPLQDHAFPGGEDPFFGNPDSAAGAVSVDGRHVFFGSPRHNSPTSKIYRRSDGATTELASPSLRQPPDPEGEQRKIFRIATADGERVLFTSAERLTDDAAPGGGEDLYRYDLAGEQMVDITAKAGATNARVQGVVGIDRDADRVYYVALGQIPAGVGADGQPNLYLWEEDGTAAGRTRFIATLDPSDAESVWRRWASSKTSQASVDGRYLLFSTAAAIPGHEGGGVRQVYRYDADATDGLACVSCNPAGDPPLGPADLPANTQPSSQAWEQPRSLSTVGTVFFDSADDLVPADTNEKVDAYLWEDGEVHLLSTGKSSADSHFYGATPDGQEAYLVTYEQLVDQDSDLNQDLYVVKVNGGLRSQQDNFVPGCEGEACRGQGSAAPGAATAASTAFRGAGNPVLRRNCARFARQARRLSRSAKRLRQVRTRSSSPGRAGDARRRIARIAKRAKRKNNQARHCRSANRRAAR